MQYLYRTVTSNWESDDHESRVLEVKLQSLSYEFRSHREKHEPKLSHDFNTRLLEQLKSIKPEQKPATSFLPEFFFQRKVQYAFSFALLTILALTVSLKWKDQPVVEKDVAKVVIENSEYWNQNSSANFANTKENDSMVNYIKKNPKSIDTLLNLEHYFYSTGKTGAAMEIQRILEQTSK